MRLDFGSRCRSEHQTLIEALVPEGTCGSAGRVRGLETHRGPRAVPIKEMDGLPAEPPSYYVGHSSVYIRPDRQAA